VPVSTAKFELSINMAVPATRRRGNRAVLLLRWTNLLVGTERSAGQ